MSYHGPSNLLNLRAQQQNRRLRSEYMYTTSLQACRGLLEPAGALLLTLAHSAC
jgi:hypothetical protein